MRNTMSKINLSSVVFLLSCTSTMFAQQKIQLLYDESCIDKMEHYFSKSTSETMESYAWRANSNSTVFFECDFSKIQTHSSLPKGVKKCGELPLTSEMVKDFQKGRRDLFLVWPNAKGGFSEAPVASAALALRNGSKTTYIEKDLSFTVDLSSSFAEQNLAEADDDFFVHQLSHSILECEPIFRLRKESKETCKPFTIYEFSPKYGIVRENTGLTQTEADQNSVELFKINGLSYIESLKKGCGQTISTVSTETTTPAPVSYSTHTNGGIVYREQPPVLAPSTDWRQVDEFRDRATTAGGGTRFSNWTETSAQPVAQPVVYSQASTAVACSQPSKSGYYLVQKGDYLNKISREQGVSLASLRKLNGLQKTDKIFPCTYLKLAATENAPAKTMAPKAQKSQKAVANPAAIYTYEQLKSGAAAQPVVYSTAVAQPSVVKAAKRPLLAASGCSGNVHEVADGQYLYAIAKIYGTTAGELAKMNGIDRFETLFPGDRLCIGSLAAVAQPEIAAAPSVYSAQPPQAVLAAEKFAATDRYVVREGDDLWSIAQRFGYTVERLAWMNGIQPNAPIFVGQSLVTEMCGQPETSGVTSNGAYIVPAEKIAEPQVIYIENGQKSWSPKAISQPAPIVYSTEASGGYRAVEPAPQPQPSLPFELYYWKDGDSEAAVAKKFGMEVSTFRQVNGLSTGEVIVVGQPVKVKAKA